MAAAADGQQQVAALGHDRAALGLRQLGAVIEVALLVEGGAARRIREDDGRVPGAPLRHHGTEGRHFRVHSLIGHLVPLPG
jgi:hypothetical protein